MVALPGLLAVMASLFLGAAWWGPVIAGVAYTVVLWTPRVLGAPLLLAAPLVLAVSLPFDTVYTLGAVLLVVVAVVATVPFFLLVGPGVAWRTVPWYAAVAAVVLVATFYLAPFDVQLVVARSDITARAQALLLLVAVVLAEAGLWLRRRLDDGA